MKFCVASGGTPLVAVNTSGNAPVWVAVPPSTRVAGVNVTPVGSAPVCETVGVGKPVVVTVNVPGVPTVKVVLAALVIAGGCWTVSVKACTAFGSDAVGGREGERVRPGGAGGRRAAERAGAVAVVRERHPARQRDAGARDPRHREPGRGDRERARRRRP